MSLLWLDRIEIGLYPGHCWMRRRGKVIKHVASSDADPGELLAALAYLLDSLKDGEVKRCPVEVFVSDSVARVMAVPWQAQLQSPSQLANYGQACFASRGTIVGDEWTVTAGYRSPGAAGIAVVLPTLWVEQVLSQLHGKGLRLASILPVSAAAYWYHKEARVSCDALLVLVEEGRLTSLLYAKGKMLSIEVEPLLGNLVMACQRLAARVLAARPALTSVKVASASGDASAATHLAEVFSDAKVGAISPVKWVVQ